MNASEEIRQLLGTVLPSGWGTFQTEHLSLASSLKSSGPLSERPEIDLGGGRLIFRSPRLLIRGRRVFLIVGDREADISRGEKTTRVLFLVM